MSAFLGKIHYWLYNKIELHEQLAEELLSAAAEKGYDVGVLRIAGHEKYGAPAVGALEDAIDHGNIHSWLQERIHSVEGRIAFSVTALLTTGIMDIGEMSQVFSSSGKAAAEGLEDVRGVSPQEMHRRVFDYMLEGMPCDRVSETLSNTDDEFSWRATRCLHGGFWEAEGGDVSNYYTLRDSWIESFVDASSSGLSYSRTADGISAIRRR